MDEGIMYSNTRKEGGKKGWNDGERRREIWMGEYLVRRRKIKGRGVEESKNQRAFEGDSRMPKRQQMKSFEYKII